MIRTLSAALAAALLAPALASAAPATPAPQPPLDRGVLKELYKPNGFFKPGDGIPLPLELPTPDTNGLYNPSGHWSAYDTNVYETLNYPLRQANDKSDQDPLGSGDPRPGWCPPDPAQPAFIPGRCANHSLEYIAHYERTMKAVLKDFGVVFHRYPFNTGDDQPPVGLPGGVTTRQGDAINPAAIVPGADHPEEMVVIGAHFDQTDGAPASAWDSAEGHASMIRMAAIMADYWRKTGTRPSASVVFIPWDAEEAGTLGSQEWLARNVAPDAAPNRIRGYFNDDPCASAYPAFYHGNPAQQVPIVLQLSDPATFTGDKVRVEAFNKQASRVIDDFWADIDDEVNTAAGPQKIYTDADRSKVVPALGGLRFFGSDYSNFQAAGVPIFNLFPDILGPHRDGKPGTSAEGITILHTPRDNIQSWNAFTDADQTGASASDGWMTGMEMCSNLYARFMLEPNMGGTQVANLDPVAYFEALPAAAVKGKLATFDATGSHQLASIATRAYVPEADLQFKWEFGDGSAPAFGKTVKHAFPRAGNFKSKLTVTNRDTHATDTMTLTIPVVEEGAGTDADPAGQNADPGLRAKNSLVACQSSAFGRSRLRRAGRGLAIIGPEGTDVTAEVFEVARGSRARKARRVARFAFKGSYRWNGRGAARTGSYFVRLTTRGTGPRVDSLSLGAERRNGRFTPRKRFQAPDTCDEISVFRLSAPSFGGKQRLKIAFTLKKAGRGTVTVYRGRRVVKRFRRTAKANRLVKITLSPKRLRRGEYKVVLSAGGKRATLYAKKL